jgi:hypothetical protein
MKTHGQSFSVAPESLYLPGFLEWIALSPAERAERSGEMWEMYLAYGGSLEPDPDPQSPFFDPEAPAPGSSNGRTGVRLIRRC